jgi:thioredoxin-like negative regulator of GroEL
MEEKSGFEIIPLTPITFAKMMTDHELVLVDFWGNGCPPCVSEGKEIEENGQQIIDAYPNIQLCKMNVDADDGISDDMDIHYIPNIVIMYKGKLAKMETGFKTVQEINAFIKDVMELIDTPKSSNLKGLIDLKDFVTHKKHTKKSSRKATKKSSKKSSKSNEE